MPATLHKSVNFIVLPLAAIIGIGSLLAFIIFLYVGPYDWVKLDIGDMQALVLNALLSLVFFLQHSGIVRRGFRHRLGRFVPPHYHGAVYTIVSGLTLIILLIFWQSSGNVMLDVQGLPEIFMRSFFFLAIVGTCWGMWALRSVDMFGLDAVIKKHKDEPVAVKPFSVRGPYRWVRHPLYLFTIMLFWSYPVITADRLLLNVLWTLWIIVGTVLEERELVEDFGDDYRDYQAKVPMLLPRTLRPVYPAGRH
jgi:protein-S-isoprenylcysteine O-methyltransferase Ste14